MLLLKDASSESSKILHIRRGSTMREYIAPGIYLCNQKSLGHRTVQRFYLHFTGFLQNKHFYSDTISTMECLGNIFFKENASRYKFISFRPTKDQDGFCLTMGKDCKEIIVELVRSFCGFIVGVEKTTATMCRI